MGLERLQKILARAGVSSRRHAEQLILAGRVQVNGQTVRELGARADPQKDRVEVDGKRTIAEAPIYVLLHKPRAVVSTAQDPEGRTTVTDLVSGIQARLYPVGRLDFQTSGALLLTNDGEFAGALLHPSRSVPKRYLAKLQGEIKDSDVQKWREGVVLDDGHKTLPAQVHLVRREDGKSWLDVVLHEGRNQQIRRMGQATGYEVLRLTRLAFAGISIEGLRAGGWRLLSIEELRQLREAYGVPRRIRPAITETTELPARGPSRKQQARRGGLPKASSESRKREDQQRDRRGGLPKASSESRKREDQQRDRHGGPPKASSESRKREDQQRDRRSGESLVRDSKNKRSQGFPQKSLQRDRPQPPTAQPTRDRKQGDRTQPSGDRKQPSKARIRSKSSNKQSRGG